MSRVPTRERSGTSIEVPDVGSNGLDLNTDPTMLAPGKTRQARNVTKTQGPLARRMGDAKVSFLTDQNSAHGSKFFGADTKYAVFTPPLIGKGGFWVPFHFTAVRPVSGVRTLWSSWVSHAEFNSIGVVWATLASTGNFTVFVNWDGGSPIATAITASALTTDAAYHAIIVYDDKAGTLTLYLNGASAGTPVAVGSGLQPRQDAGVNWYVGVSYDPGVGVSANSGFQGSLDAFGCHTLAGADLTDEDTTAVPPRASILANILRWNWQDCPCPFADDVLFHYGMDEAAAGTGSMYDSSERQNHGTYFGSPTNAPRVAIRAQNTNFLGTTRLAAVGSLQNGTVNVAIAGGDHYYQRLTPGV